MDAKAELYRLIDLAIESHKRLRSEKAPDLSFADYDTLVSYVSEARERARCRFRQ